MFPSNLRWFDEEEFREWSARMSHLLLRGLDLFRQRAGVPIMVSPHPLALGRTDEKWQNSQHYVSGQNDVVKAVDVMFPKCNTRIELEYMWNVARDLNWFSGLGVYPHWKPFAGMHLDVRYTRDPRVDPALWGAVLDKDGKQVYTGWKESIKEYNK